MPPIGGKPNGRSYVRPSTVVFSWRPAGVDQDAGQELPLGEGGTVAVAGRVGLHAAGDVAENGARQEAARGFLEVIEAEDVLEPARDVGAAAPAGDAEVGLAGVGGGVVHVEVTSVECPVTRALHFVNDE